MLPLMIDDKFEAMPWDRVDAAVFDVGNVLLRFEPRHIMETLLPDRPELYDRLMVKVFRSPYWVMMDHGLAEPEEAAEAMIGRDTELAPYIRTVAVQWSDMKHVISEGVAAVRACVDHGLKTFVMSNYGDSTFRIIEEKYDFFRLFDGKLVSSRVGLMKPDPEIYRRLIREFDLTPERTLFVDDNPANIEMALYLGWQGFCMNEEGRLSRFMGLSPED